MKILKKNLAGEVVFEYGGEVVSRDGKSILVEAYFNRDDMPFQGITLKRNDRFMETYYTDRWYNIFEIYDRDDGKLKGWYCNLTTPAVIEDDSISYIDLALDLWVSADGVQTILDEDEMEELNLNDEYRNQVFAGLQELMEMFEQKIPR